MALEWVCALTLDANRQTVAGSAESLAGAIRAGADLRIYTEFRHNEHVDVNSDNPERIQEMAEFGVTYLIEDRWVGGIMGLRQPVSLPGAFGPQPSMSFFLYNQDGSQAIARPLFANRRAHGSPGPSPLETFPDMAKYHCHDSWDGATNAPSNNFTYEFDTYRFWTGTRWREVFAHDASGVAQRGSVGALATAVAAGSEVKVGIGGICSDLAPAGTPPLAHELFIQAGSCYYYTEQRLFVAGTHPVVRVRPAIPMRYGSRGWDFGWLLLRTDGHVVYRRCDPYTLQFTDITLRLPVRWFVR